MSGIALKALLDGASSGCYAQISQRFFDWFVMPIERTTHQGS